MRMYGVENIFVKAYTLGMTRTLRFDLVTLFAALADPTRLRLLNLMDGREVCVCYFVEILKQGQPKISRHLAYLRRAGIVESRRDGKWMHYRIERPDDHKSGSILMQPSNHSRQTEDMQADLARLGQACCEASKVRNTARCAATGRPRTRHGTQIGIFRSIGGPQSSFGSSILSWCQEGEAPSSARLFLDV